MPNRKTNNKVVVDFPAFEVNIIQNLANLKEENDPDNETVTIVDLQQGPFSIQVKIPKHQKFKGDVLTFEVALDGRVVATLCVPQVQIESSGFYTHTITSITDHGLRKRLEALKGLCEVSVKISKCTGGRTSEEYVAYPRDWMAEPSGEAVRITAAYDEEGRPGAVVYLDDVDIRFLQEREVMRFRVAEERYSGSAVKGGKPSYGI